MNRTVINRTVVAVALSVVVAGVGVADLWLDRNASSVDDAGPAGPVISSDAVVILPLPERPTNAETVGDLIQGLVDAVDKHANQKYASKREGVVPEGGGDQPMELTPGIARSSRRGLM